LTKKREKKIRTNKTFKRSLMKTNKG